MTGVYNATRLFRLDDLAGAGSAVRGGATICGA